MIHHYHADNGRFAEALWRHDTALQGQQLTFCGVSAHHQNGRAEKKIRDLHDLARTSFIHANRRWPDAINAFLWPYALRKANESLNKTVSTTKSTSPIELFTGVKVTPNVNDNHPFGCPVYALDGNLQNKMKNNKWISRSRLGIYLGPSLQHARSIGLVLSLITGLVSPQYHLKYDNTFETVLPSAKAIIPKSEWQRKCHFIDTATSTQSSSNDPVSEGGQLTRMMPVVMPHSESIQLFPIDDDGHDPIIQSHQPATREIPQNQSEPINRNENLPPNVPAGTTENTLPAAEQATKYFCYSIWTKCTSSDSFSRLRSF